MDGIDTHQRPARHVPDLTEIHFTCMPCYEEKRNIRGRAARLAYMCMDGGANAARPHLMSATLIF